MTFKKILTEIAWTWILIKIGTSKIGRCSVKHLKSFQKEYVEDNGSGLFTKHFLFENAGKQWKYDNSSNTKGEIQAISTIKARNEKIDPFSRAKVGHKVDMKEVSGGLGPFGLPASCKKKQ
ncbi:7407_t:CDS:2 [Ambispora gerdemannii]|uniref:7407_t:CDS:1 n=1 Tax=Ambispora gerdemannii TaxID=144530 RepID=A0A9N9G4H7_9GLOM|nr:7407_t:CDS:2 [Ambispora gerdemannii]